ncbi:MAG TPA: pilus assembly protein TadG-related protein [Planktothrix sp.]|jgi:hypothetical protein
MIRKRRRQNGNIIVMVVVVICLILVPLLIVVSQAGVLTVDRGRIQNSVDAAGLAAANDLARVVINDPEFGFVALSNYPAVGEATTSADGEPLPVSSINTLSATIRQNTIVANALGNETMTALCDLDRARLQETQRALNEALTKSLLPNGREQFFDIHGTKVDPCKDVSAMISSSVPGKVALESVKLSTGWISSATGSETPLPQPVRMAQIKLGQALQRNYRAFVDIPACGRSFTFAGVSANSRMVPPEAFHPADGKHICSIVKIECVVAWRNKTLLPFGSDALSKARFIACCQPYGLADTSQSGLMLVNFCSAPPPNLVYWSDFLRPSNFHDRQVNEYLAYGGDFPTDHNASLYRFSPERQTTDQQFAEHFYHWLRNAHTKPRIDSVLELMNEQFRPSPEQILSYNFAADGTISCKSLNQDPFPSGITSDRQCSAVCDTAIEGGLSPIIIFRDNVKRFGTINGGKHAGQPLAIDPAQANQQGGRFSLAMLPVANRAGMRRSYDDGGLAVEVEIGGIGPSTAQIDVARMRRLKR